jgi:hypothetical protein
MSCSGLRGRRLYVIGINVDLLILYVQLEMDHKCNEETLIDKGRAGLENKVRGPKTKLEPKQ